MDRNSSVEVVVLAAGEGTRMRSRLPKPLHLLAGRPLLAHVLDAAATLAPERIHVVVGAGAGRVREAFDDRDAVAWVTQSERRGTGHAVMQALPGVSSRTVLVLPADVPLMRPELLARCVDAAAAGIALITATVPDPNGLGRIVRDRSGAVAGIVEERDASAAQRAIDEINTGILAAPVAVLGELLAAVTSDNAQGEYYLTDVVGLACERGVPVRAIAGGEAEALGVNDRAQLAAAERACQAIAASRLMAGGVSLADPARIDVRGDVSTGQDCFVDVNVVFEGSVRLGDGVMIEPGCVIRDAVIADGTRIKAHSVIDGANIGERCEIGPFARLRPGTDLGASVRIGNFVETKKARLGAGAKASHLAYLGDATLGADCNVGAGAITCNYDGIDKHETRIGDGVFIGTNATLVAPLTIEDEAFIGAGSTVTSRVRRGDLAVGRAKQRNISGWSPPAKRKAGPT